MGKWPPLAHVVRAEWDEVVRVAERCGVANGECPDVALEVFFRYALFRASISSPRAIPSWLRSTAVHVAYQFRTRAIARHETPRPPAELENVGSVASAEEELSAFEGERELHELVDGLEADRREVFRRHALQDQPIHAIAVELGIPESTAYNRFHLARADLQAALRRAEKIEERRLGLRRFGLFSFLFFLRRETAERWWLFWRGLRARLRGTPLVLQGFVVLVIGAGVATGGGEGPTPMAGAQAAVSPREVAVQAVPPSSTPPPAEVESPVDTGMLPGEWAGEVPSREPRHVVVRPPSSADSGPRTGALTADRLATAAARAALSRGSTRDAWARLRDDIPLSPISPLAAPSNTALPGGANTVLPGGMNKVLPGGVNTALPGGANDRAPPD